MRWKHALLALLLLLLASARAHGDTLWLYSVHSQEELRIARLAQSRVNLATLRSANRFFRSRKTHRRRAVHPRLLRTLAHVQKHFGNRRIEVVSGYRTPAEGQELNSYHQVGRAADVYIAGISKERLFAFCRTLAHMGCGYYPKAKFVHFDVRGSSALWVDRSAPGKPRDYAPNPRRWLHVHGL